MEVETFSERDVVVQMAQCSFDIHVEDIVGTLVTGGTLVMLRPDGHMDFEYLSRVLIDHQITYLHTVPTLLTSFLRYLKARSDNCALALMRSVCCIGE